MDVDANRWGKSKSEAEGKSQMLCPVSDMDSHGYEEEAVHSNFIISSSGSPCHRDLTGHCFENPSFVPDTDAPPTPTILHWKKYLITGAVPNSSFALPLPSSQLAENQIKTERQSPMTDGSSEGGIHGMRADFDEDSLMSTSESCSWKSESRDEQLPDLKEFRGQYNFWAEPGEDCRKVNFAYLPECKKIFCKNDVPVLFHFYLDFEKAQFTDLAIQAVIYHTSNTVRFAAVEDCPGCHSCDPKNFKAHRPPGFGASVIRCDNPHATYAKERQIHNYVSVPVEKPQTGNARILFNYRFMSLNTCLAKTKGKDRKHWTLVFYLVEGRNQVVGQAMFDLKVSKSPKRDASIEEKKQGAADCSRRSKRTSPILNFLQPASIEEDAQSPGGSRTPRTGVISSGAAISTSPTGPFRSQAADIFSLLDASDDYPLEEHVQIENFINKMMDLVRLAIARRKHPDKVYSDFAEHQIKKLKRFKQAMEFAENQLRRADN